MRTLFASSIFALAAGIVPSVAHADPADRFVRQDRREVRHDRRATMDDQFDYVRLRNLLVRFDRARSLNDVRMLQTLEVELDGQLAEELRESRRELFHDRREPGRAQVEAYHLQQKRIIQQELASVAGRQDQPALGYRRERIVRLLQLGTQELREDHRQAR